MEIGREKARKREVKNGLLSFAAAADPLYHHEGLLLKIAAEEGDCIVAT